MLKRSRLALPIVLIALPTAGYSQEASGRITAGIGQSSVSDGGGDATTTSLDFIGSLSFGQGFNLNVDGSTQEFDADDLDASIGADTLGVKLTYQIPSGLAFGAYAENTNVDISGTGPLSGLSLDGELKSYGLTLGYVIEGFGVEAFYGMSDTDPGLPDQVDVTDMGLNLRYVTGNATWGGHLVGTEIDVPGGSLDVSSWGIGGEVPVGKGWSVFAGLGGAAIDDLDLEASTFGLGVGYDFSVVSQVPAVASLELARSKVDDGVGDITADTIRFGLTIPLGRSASKMPLNSVARGAIAPRHSAITTLIETF